MTGRIPDELIKEAKGGEVHVNMEDHKHEEYVKPKVINSPNLFTINPWNETSNSLTYLKSMPKLFQATLKAFSGQGFTLGSAAPEIAGAGGRE